MIAEIRDLTELLVPDLAPFFPPGPDFPSQLQHQPHISQHAVKLPDKSYMSDLPRGARREPLAACRRPPSARPPAAGRWAVASALGFPQVVADLVGEFVDPLFGLHQCGLGAGGTLRGPPLPPGRRPARKRRPWRPTEHSHDPVLSVRDAGSHPHPSYPPAARLCQRAPSPSRQPSRGPVGRPRRRTPCRARPRANVAAAGLPASRGRPGGAPGSEAGEVRPGGPFRRCPATVTAPHGPKPGRLLPRWTPSTLVGRVIRPGRWRRTPPAPAVSPSFPPSGRK
jgi:hypothetical protein